MKLLKYLREEKSFSLAVISLADHCKVGEEELLPGGNISSESL